MLAFPVLRLKVTNIRLKQTYNINHIYFIWALGYSRHKTTKIAT